MCDDELFWRNRARTRYGKLVKFHEPGTTWKSFYTELVNNAMYLVEISYEKVYIYSDIKRAYDMLWREIAAINEITLEQALTTDFNTDDFDDAFIVLIYKDKIVSVHDKYTLFDYKRRATDILQYHNLPGLNFKNKTLFYYSGSGLKIEVIEEDIIPEGVSMYSKYVGVFDYIVNVAAALMKYVPEYKVDRIFRHTNIYHILSIDSDDSGKYLHEFTYGYITKGELNVEDGYYNPTLLVNDPLFDKPLNFQEFSTPTVGPFPSRTELEEIDEQIRQYYKNN